MSYILKISLAGLLFVAGCASSGSTQQASSGGADMLPPALRTPTAAGDATPTPAATPAPRRATGMPTPPAGAQWTIFCLSIPGPDHVALANRTKDELIRQTKMSDWYVIHQEGQSALYYGFYKTFNTPDDPDTARAQRDRKVIDELRDNLANRPFKHAFFVALDSPDPAAPPDWNLANTGGAYSLQIAAYAGSPLRKQYAVDAVREARAQGLDAYYFHGQSTSSVCVGVFPAEAIRKRQMITNETGDQEQPVIASQGLLSEAAARAQRDKAGRPVKVEEERIEIVDPRLRELMIRFPYHAVNGEVPITRGADAAGKPTEVPAPSFVVDIPKPAESPLSAPAFAAEPPPMQVTPQPQPGVGTLRRIGE